MPPRADHAKRAVTHATAPVSAKQSRPDVEIKPSHPTPSTSPRTEATASSISSTNNNNNNRRRRRSSSRVLPKLSAAERQRRQRLRLLQLACHGASVAAALLASAPQPLAALRPDAFASSGGGRPAVAVISSSETANVPRSNAQRSAVLHRRAQADANQRPTAAAMAMAMAGTAVTGGNGDKTSSGSSRVVSGAAAQETYTAAHATEPQRVKAEDSTAAWFTEVLQAPPTPFTAVPCSYAQLWSVLLRLQLVQPTKTEEADALFPAITAETTNKRRKSTKAAARTSTDATSSVERSINAKASPRPVESLSSLADEMQAMNDGWRAFFLGGSNRDDQRVSAVKRQITGAKRPTPLSQAYSPSLSCGEQYTLRRYASVPSSPVSFALFGGGCVESGFFMDHL